MTTLEIVNKVMDLLLDDRKDAVTDAIRGWRSTRDAGLTPTESGFLLRLADGSRFHIVIARLD